MSIQNLVSFAFVFFIAMQAAFAQSLPPEDARFIFRYKPSSFSGSVQNPDPWIPPEDVYDITARFVGVVGEPVEATIPTKTGIWVARWMGRDGSLPSGLHLDPDSGTITGTPTRVQKTHMSALGYSADGGSGNVASVTFEILDPSSLAGRIDAYGHVERGFSAMLTRQEVHSWVPAVPVPGWMSVSGSMLQGTPPAGSEGVYGVAFRGFDHLGAEIAFSYGTVTIETGPKVSFIDDVTRHPSDLFDITGRVARSVGSISWSIEGAVPANIGFNKRTARLRGRIPTFSTSSTIRFVARDVDGTVGHSNWFTLSTFDPVLALSDPGDRHLTLGEYASFAFAAEDLAGTQTWTVADGVLPEGLSMDGETGRISGTPGAVGRTEGLVVRVETSVGGTSQSTPFAIEVFPGKIEVSSDVAHVRTGVPFTTEPPEVAGAAAPWSFSLAEGAAMPDGLTLDPSGVVSGQVALAGNQSVAAVLTDADGRSSSTVTLGIEAYDPLAIEVGPSPFQLPRQSRIDPIIASVEGVVPSSLHQGVRFELTGALPAGLSFNPGSGVVTGTPTMEGSYGPFSMSITDGSGSTATSAQFFIDVTERLGMEAVASDLSVTSHFDTDVVAAAAENAVGTVSWELDSGDLPTGLSVHANGRLRGVTTMAGEHPGIVLKATDSEMATALTAPFTISVVPPEDISFGETFEWSVGKPFSHSLRAQNAVPGATYEIADGSQLPSGAAVSPSGILSGTVTGLGETTTRIRVTDPLGRSAEGDLTVRILPLMTMELASEHAVARQSQVRIVPIVHNGIAPLSFSLSGTLPPGLSLDGTTGSIHGVPAVEGSWGGISMTAVDRTGTSRTATVRIVVGERNPLSLAYDFSRPLTVNSAAGLPLLPVEPTNAVGATSFSMQGELPPGLAFNAGTGAFGGRPLQSGSFGNIVVSATDSEGESSATDPMTIVVSTGGQLDLDDVVRTVRGGSYVDTGAIMPANAVAPFLFRSDAVNLSGLSLISSTGSWVGTPAGFGKTVANMTLEDAAGRTRDFRFTLDVVGALAVSYADAVVNRHAPVSIAPAAENVIGEASYTVTAGRLPAGLSLDPETGVIAGTPSGTETASGIVVSVTDDGITGNAASSAPFSITVGDRLPLSVEVPENNTVIGGHPYSLTLKAINAVGPVTWSVSGDLPDGLSFNAASGTVAGVATRIGLAEGITFQASDSAGGAYTTSAVSFTVASNGLPIRLTTYDLMTKPGIAFVTKVPRVSNAIGDVSFKSDELSAYGLAIDPVTGELSGSFSEPVTITVNIDVTDSSNRLTSEPVSIEVMPNLRVTVRETIDVVVNASMTAVYPVTDYRIGTVSYELVGKLPEGLSFSPATGGIFGTPIELGTFGGLYIRGTDSVGDTHLSDAFRVVVHESGILPQVGNYSDRTARVGSNVSFSAVSWNPKKVGDVVSLNKPLPEGLSLDSETGVISGTPAAGTPGVYEGYAFTVTDAVGLSGYGSEFKVSVLPQNTASFSLPATRTRAGQPFDSGPVAYDPQTVVGLPVFSASSLPPDIVIDPETGALSGTTSSSRTIYISAEDDIQRYSTFSASISILEPRVIYPSSQTFEAGASIVTAEPELVNAVGTPTFALTAGVLPEGLNLDSATGVISGTMFEGTLSGLRVTATDEFGAAQSNAFSLVGADRNPDPFVWEDVDGVERGELITTANYSLTGYTHGAPVTVTSTNGTAQFGCSRSSGSCSHSTWVSEGVTGEISPGALLRIRVNASDQYDTPVTVTVTVGDTSSTWTVRTRPQDITPDVFDFVDQTDILKNTTVTHDSFRITGLRDVAEVNVSGPEGTEYRVWSGGGSGPAWSKAGTPATLSNNWVFHVRTVSASQDDTPVRVNVEIGTETFTWTVTTRPFDDYPDEIVFEDLIGETPYGFTKISNRVLISGISDPVEVTLETTGDPTGLRWSDCNTASGGSCSAKTSGQTVADGRYIYLTAMNPQEWGETVTVTVRAGSRTAVWNLNTRELDLVPDDFDLVDLVDQPSGVSTEGPMITLSGIPDYVPVSWSGPPGSSLYTCGGSSCGGAARTRMRDGDRFRMTIRTSDLPDADSTMSITIGDVTKVWTVRTAPADYMPDDFSLPGAVDAIPSRDTQSDRVLLSGVIHHLSVSITGPGGQWRHCPAATGTSGCSGFTSSTTVKAPPGRYLEFQGRSGDNGETRDYQIQVGDLEKEWSITTRDLVPPTQPLAFGSVTDALPDTQYVSSGISMAGIVDSFLVGIESGPGSAELCFTTRADGSNCSWYSFGRSVGSNQHVFVRVTTDAAAMADVVVNFGPWQAVWSVSP